MRSAMTTADRFGTRVTGSIPVSPTYERRLDPLPVEEANFRAIHVQCGCRTHPASTHSSRSTTTAPEQYCDPHDEVGSICAAPGHRHAYGQHRRSWPRYCRHRTSGEGRPCRLRVLAHPGRVEGTQARHRLSSFVARRSRRTRASRRGRAATRRAAFVPAFVPHAPCRPGVASPAPWSPPTGKLGTLPTLSSDVPRSSLTEGEEWRGRGPALAPRNPHSSLSPCLLGRCQSRVADGRDIATATSHVELSL
jgi:hypothetical protein